MDAARQGKCCGVYRWGTSLSSGLLESRLRFKIPAGSTTWALPGFHSGAVAPSGPSTGTSPDECTASSDAGHLICLSSTVDGLEWREEILRLFGASPELHAALLDSSPHTSRPSRRGSVYSRTNARGNLHSHSTPVLPPSRKATRRSRDFTVQDAGSQCEPLAQVSRLEGLVHGSVRPNCA